MFDFGELERKRFIARERRRDIICEALWMIGWLAVYLLMLSVILASYGCSTFDDAHRITIKSDLDTFAAFDLAKFQRDHIECRNASDRRTIGPWPGIVGIASFPLGVAAALGGTIHAHYASEATEIDYRNCMRKRGYDVKANRADR